MKNILNKLDFSNERMEKMADALDKKLETFFSSQFALLYKVLDKLFGYSYRETDHGIYALFASPDKICKAAQFCSKNQYDDFDCFTPFPVHHLEKHMGLKPSKLTYVAFWGGIIGLLLAFFLQYNAHEQFLPAIFPYFDAFPNIRSYPLNIGGKPTFSWPPMVPIAFELVVLVSGQATVLFFMLLAKLFKPSRQPLHPSITNDKFCIWIAEKSSNYNKDSIVAAMKEQGAMYIAKQNINNEKKELMQEVLYTQ